MKTMNQWTLFVATALILLTLSILSINNWSPHICNTVLSEGNIEVGIFRTNTGKYELQVINNTSSTEVKESHVLNHSKESRFRAATCQEDLQHLQEIMNTNVDVTSPSELREILYKSVTRPVQGK